jgi:hypothetical protein
MAMPIKPEIVGVETEALSPSTAQAPKPSDRFRLKARSEVRLGGVDQLPWMELGPTSSMAVSFWMAVTARRRVIWGLGREA